MTSLDKFRLLLARAPGLEAYWRLDQQTPEVRLAELKKRMGTMSRGELLLASFFLAVWSGNAKGAGFDLVDACGALDADSRRIVADWVLDPFWP